MTTESERLTKLRTLLAAEPNDGFLLYGMAQELHKLGRFAEAADHYDRAIAVDPKGAALACPGAQERTASPSAHR
jgi:cytochrome c-type biogenesis protein CcmH/NrfG